jgi:hypothetical protein
MLYLLITGSILIPLVQTYCTCLTELNPGTKKCANSNFERVLQGLYFRAEGYFSPKVRNLNDVTVSASSKKSSIFVVINKYFTRLFMIQVNEAWSNLIKIRPF